MNFVALDDGWQGQTGLSVYFVVGAEADQLAAVEELLRQSPSVLAARLTDADQALQEFMAASAESSSLTAALEMLSDNPLPASLQVSVVGQVTVEDLGALREEVLRFGGVDDVVIEHTWLERLRSLTQLVERLGLILGALFALGAVLVAGVLFLIISLTPLRAWLINSIPRSLKLGIGAGIGLFLAIIGLEIMGVVGDHPVTLVTLGDIKNPLVILGCLTFVAIIVMEKLNIKGNIIIGIIIFSIIAWVSGLAKFNGVVGSIPPMTYLFEFDLKAAFTAGMSTVIFTLLFIDFFDTAGTLTSVANVAGKVDSKGKVQDINKAMMADSVGTVAGALMGTTTVTSYVESGAGVKAGGRTGMTSLVIGVLFLACLFFSPLATSLPKEIDGAALLYVAILFVRNITNIEWDDISESGPAVVAMITMPLTYSISNGIALAFISYALIKILSGKFSKTSPAIWVIAVLSVISFYVA